MTNDLDVTAQIRHEVMQRYGVTPVGFLGHRLNETWLVASEKSRLVLRGYPSEPIGEITYELKVLRRLHSIGWPVPLAVEDLLHIDGRTWCLFTWLPGTCRPRSVAEGRVRGRLLAELHGSSVHLTELGQRDGCCFADEVINDPELETCLRGYESIYPIEGHIMRWHLEQTQAIFACIEKEKADIQVLHSDFTPWNLLFDGERLTGILDFEGTHLDYRVADFALSWRGEYDEVIDGYQDVLKLTEIDTELLFPVYWAWCFLGVKEELQAKLIGHVPSHDFKWRIDHLLRRSSKYRCQMPLYPGRQ